MRLVSIIFLILSFSSALQADEEADFLLKKGKVEYQNEMYTFAFENISRAYHLDPGLYEAASLLGDLYNRKKNKMRALEYYNASLALNDKQDMTHVRAGELEDFYAQYNRALDHFLRACELNADNHLALLGAARIYSVINNTKLADEYFTRSYELRRATSDPIIRLGDKKYSDKRYAEAEQLYSTALRENPADLKLHYTLSSLRRLMKKYREAAGTLEYLVYLRPHETRAYVQLALLYFSERSYKKKSRELEASIEAIEKAIALSPDSAEYRNYAAEIYRAAGNEKMSKFHEKKAEEIENRAPK
jgi:protein O-GlcNAc transferase